MNTLVIVDVQNDFLPGGPLGVPEGDQVIPVLNRIVPAFDLVVATQDWHPPDHGSFAASHPGRSPGEVIDLNGLEQVLWPVHAVERTPGAEFAPDLHMGRVERVFRKGTDRDVDSYSGFFDNGRRRATGLGEYLTGRGVDSVYVGGLATDYCVKFTALDAVGLGFRTVLIEDACRGVNLRSGDVDRALEELAAAGVELVRSASLPASAGSRA